MSEYNVVVYTSDRCIHCTKVLELLREWDIEFTEKNISQNADFYIEMKEMGVYGTPVTYIDGQQVLGFQKRKLKKYLGIDEVSSYIRQRTLSNQN
ncbi:glutaredoxin family protein [Pontibacillus yanchengensis]|uniref:Glutaredoxin family protein n=2 Tax=Pontibacillus yanchengensis TaxID=462910 RepID=A0ACC7VLW3_9BACI|nr:glutaredoxin family protein [Pontibacillus yanchengensis]MYL35070.1 glutaredoxin family protein [Pontibacillus yanchengensis]MYL55219.1 glutaredoxin family protein [Pontibacillus yanchengensis]